MPIVVHNSFHNAQVSGNTATLTPPWTPTNGRTLLTWGLRGFDTTNSVTDNGSDPIPWTRDLNTNWFSLGDLFIYRRQVVAGSPTSVLLTSDNTFAGNMDCGLLEVSGIDPANPVDTTVAYGLAPEGAGNSHSRPITTNYAGSLVFGIALSDDPNTNFQDVGTTVQLQENALDHDAVIYELLAAAGAQSLTWGTEQTRTCGAALVAYRAAGAGGRVLAPMLAPRTRWID